MCFSMPTNPLHHVRPPLGFALSIHLAVAAITTVGLDWSRPDSPASLGLNKGSHFRWESTPISQNTLLLLVSGKMSPKITLMLLISKWLFPSKFRMSNEKIPAKICKFWIDQWRPWSQSPCTGCPSETRQTGLCLLCDPNGFTFDPYIRKTVHSALNL